MAVTVSKRNERIPDSMRDYAEQEVQGVIESYPKINGASVILGLEKSRYKAEVVVHGKNINIEADKESFDVKEAVDQVVDKIDRQLRRRIDKVQDHHKTARFQRKMFESVIAEEEKRQAREEELDLDLDLQEEVPVT